MGEKLIKLKFVWRNPIKTLFQTAPTIKFSKYINLIVYQAARLKSQVLFTSPLLTFTCRLKFPLQTLFSLAIHNNYNTQSPIMQNALIMNKILLPRYFDGTNWNTVFKPTRRSIPKYLHEDLPELKLLQLKERFKQIGKFNCPRLEYFDDYIRKHNTHRNKVKTSRSTSNKKEYERLEEQLQYALLLCDKDSSVLDGLVNKAKVVKFQKEKKPFEKGRYFQGTIDLVFRNRKNVYLSQQKHKREEETPEEVAKKVDGIKLLSFT